jgi:hypothetical protein
VRTSPACGTGAAGGFVVMIEHLPSAACLGTRGTPNGAKALRG